MWASLNFLHKCMFYKLSLNPFLWVSLLKKYKVLMSLKFWQRNFVLVKVISQITKECNVPYTYFFLLFVCFVFFVDETFARLVDNYMRPAIHKGVPPLFNNIRNLYSDKEKVILRSCTASLNEYYWKPPLRRIHQNGSLGFDRKFIFTSRLG